MCILIWVNVVVAGLLGCCTVGAAGPARPEPKTAVVFTVALDGDDAWSGALPKPNRAKTDGPFATLERARDAVRALKKAGSLPAGGVEVQVRGGTYELGKAFSLTAEDAGTEAAPVVYRAAPKEKVILTGARRITGFVPHQGEILKADVGAQGFQGVFFRQLLLDGKRQHLARYPNFDPNNPHGGGFAYVDGQPISMYRDLPEENLRVIQCRERDVRRWAHPEQAEVIIFPRYNWINMAVPVASADPEKRTITLGKDISWGPFKGIRPLDRYYVRNLLEELDSPGEWYLDKESWTLYFWPPMPVEKAAVRAPVIESIVEMGPKADWITLRGFTLEGCEGSAVVVRGSENCLIAGNTIHDTGGKLGYSAGVWVQGGHNCGVVGNDLHEVCNNGIRLEGDWATRGDLVPVGHYADNNYIHHIGVLNGHGCGIYLSGMGLRASHNLIHDTTRCGIFGGGTDCVVEYNHIRHVNLETEDTGGYYNGGNWHIRGQIVRYNYIHDVLGYGRTGNRWTSPHYAWGIYLDDDNSGTHVYGNIVARTTLGGSHIHAGRDNILENNIFIEGANQQMQYSGHDPKSWVVTGHREEFKKAMQRPAWRERYPELAAADPEALWVMEGNKFRRNIICYSGPKARLYQYRPADAPEKNESDYNLVWHFGQPLDLGLSGVPPEKQWEEWQKRGYDAHSVVADPLFVNPDKGDYRLKPNSPALKLGFQPIPVEKIGLYKSDLRASWPVVEALGVRETPLVETVIDIPEAPARQRPQAPAPKVGAAPIVDGEVKPGEWPEPGLALKERPDGSTIAGAACEARLCHDGMALYVSVTVPVRDAAKLRRGDTWELCDAAEVCFQDLSGAAPGPVFVIHSFASGAYQSVTEAGAPAMAAQKLGTAAHFRAKAAAGQWAGEWTIPLSAAGITYRPGLKLALNLGVRRTESAEWIQWRGSGATWNVKEAGTLTLE